MIKEWENEPNSLDYWINGNGLLYAKYHRTKRIRKKWFKKYGVQPSNVRLHALILRTELKHLCGYVGVPYNHPYFGIHYNDNIGHMEVHGGITFSRHGYMPLGFRHDYWYFGFDCAHLYDYIPGMEELLDSLDKSRSSSRTLLPFLQSTYRNIGYVKEEVHNLAIYLLFGSEPNVV